MTTTTDPHPSDLPHSADHSARPAAGAARRRLLRVASIIGSALLAWLVLLAATAVLGIDVVAPGPAGTAAVTGPAVLVATLVAGLLGWALLAILERVAPRRGRTVWTVIAAAVGLLSVLAGPTAAATVSATVVLTLLHLLVTVGIVVGFRASARS